MSGIACTARNFKFCLSDANRYCDGYKDCDDGVDEDPRLCEKGKDYQMFITFIF